jgi:hypothetical protein
MQTIHDLSQDLVHIHLIKNENMELEIEKMDALKKEITPD